MDSVYVLRSEINTNSKNSLILTIVEDKKKTKMAETNSCESCGFLEVKPFDMTKLEFDVIPDDQITGESKADKKVRKRLEKRYKKESNRDKNLRKILKELIVLVGQGQIVNTISKAVARLLERNYPNLVEWKGVSKLVIFIPDFYLNKVYID